MTLNDIKECFDTDKDLINYYDPTSNVSSNEEAIVDIYHKLVDHAKDGKCTFYKDEIGYIFYREKLLISFCVKKEYRDKYNLSYFGNLIKSKVGHNFDCFLFNKNKRAISFLERLGMAKIMSNDLITLLSI